MKLYSFLPPVFFLLASSATAEYWGTGQGQGQGNHYNTASDANTATQTSSGWPSWSSTPGTVLVQTVQVSTLNGTKRFFPEKIVAPAGSYVQFQFLPANHTVTQSTFAKPCVPINAVMPNVTGIDSGFQPVAAANVNAATNTTLIDVPIFTVPIRDASTPIWIYCAQHGHCAAGMSMVINEVAGSNKTLEAYKAAAAALVSSSSSSLVVATSASSIATTSTTSTTTTTIAVSTASAISSTSALLATSPPGTTTSSASVATFTGSAARIGDGIILGGALGVVLAGLALLF